MGLTLLPSLSAAEGSLAVDFDFDFDFNFDFVSAPDCDCLSNLDGAHSSATKLDPFPVPTHTLIVRTPPFSHLWDIQIVLHVWNGHSCPLPLTLTLTLISILISDFDLDLRGCPTRRVFRRVDTSDPNGFAAAVYATLPCMCGTDTPVRRF